MKSAVIIGDRADSHVHAVLARIESLGGPPPLVVDAPSLVHQPYSLADGLLVVAGQSVNLKDGGTGWLRRYAPSLWGAGLVEGSLDAARKRSVLSLIGSVTRIGDRRWLTDLECMLRAEDRLLQLEAVRALGYSVPDSIVTSDADHAASVLGRRFVVKPLTIGYYNTDDGPRAVYASVVEEGELHKLDFADAPFVAQELIVARAHLRVVTVHGQVWVASIQAEGRPLDWREQPSAHTSWEVDADEEVAAAAIDVAKSFQIGYSSQDWIRDESGRLVFLDLNPGGQWMFLPDMITKAVTAAIASFMVTGRS